MGSRSDNPSVEKPWTISVENSVSKLEVDPENGLTGSEVKRRLEQYGHNRLRSVEPKSTWKILLEQFDSLVIWLLMASALLSFAFGEWVDGSAVVAVILINSAIGFFTELNAVRSMEALREIGSVNTTVRREGQVKQVSAEELVPGDIIVVEGGDVVTADMRIIEASKLQANESALTGESVPVGKDVSVLEEDVPLAERKNMLFKGTGVTRGSGFGVVTATGMDTELGHISSLVEEAQEESTPLEKRIDKLGQNLVWVTLGIIVIVALVGIVRGKELLLMIETAVALAVAAVPEGLPIVATIALARGLQRMAARNALVNRLASVETLGGTNVICTDKTGTLTENQMTVSMISLPGEEIEVTGEGLEEEGQFLRDGTAIDPMEDERLGKIIEVGMLCNNANLSGQDNGTVGDPLEIALLVTGKKAGLDRDELLEESPEEREVAFDPDTKMMATYNRKNGSYQVAVKGAPEMILQACSHILTPDGEGKSLDDDQRQQWEEQNDRLAAQGLRMLGTATKQVESVDADPYEDLVFLGLVGMIDPPRQEVKPAISSCKDAGIDVVMVTGDLPVTARSIALELGLAVEGEAEVIHGRELKKPEELSKDERQRILSAKIFARVSPEDKLNLIALHKQNGLVVAMTGDGVNDAPALKKADIGIAMGLRGTQIAREAADIVLQDDAFNTIVEAVRQGRAIFNNLRKFVLYLLSCNVSEVMVVFVASLINTPLPIRPLQILFLNLVTDVFPALALGISEGDESLMERPPRDPQEPIMKRENWLAVSGYGAIITVAVLSSFILASTWLGVDGTRQVTISFLTLAFAQLWQVFNMRSTGSNIFRNEVTRNPYVWGALLLCIGLLLAAVYVPPLATILRVTAPTLEGWGLVIGMSLVPLAIGQIIKEINPGQYFND
jgi:Ca2+-transporting ATPase